LLIQTFVSNNESPNYNTGPELRTIAGSNTGFLPFSVTGIPTAEWQVDTTGTTGTSVVGPVLSATAQYIVVLNVCGEPSDDNVSFIFTPTFSTGVGTLSYPRELRWKNLVADAFVSQSPTTQSFVFTIIIGPGIAPRFSIAYENDGDQLDLFLSYISIFGKSSV
jgi:hypothetical protein